MLAALVLPPAAMARTPVVTLQTKSFGRILATPGKLALYYWRKEKVAGGRIRCTGGCAKARPPRCTQQRDEERKPPGRPEHRAEDPHLGAHLRVVRLARLDRRAGARRRLPRVAEPIPLRVMDHRARAVTQARQVLVDRRLARR